jgi:hypothetical protein
LVCERKAETNKNENPGRREQSGGRKQKHGRKPIRRKGKTGGLTMKVCSSVSAKRKIVNSLEGLV